MSEIPFINEDNLSPHSKKLEYEVGENGCWNVISHATMRFGYVRIKRSEGRVLAHRYVYTLYNKVSILDGFVVRHKCDNPTCVNPQHLELGTSKDNSQDMIYRGRLVSSNGSKNGRAILTEKEVKEIRMNVKHTRKELSEMYGVTTVAIRLIDTYKTWKHIVVDEKFNYRPKERGGNRKLSDKDVKEILNDNSTMEKIGKKYGVSSGTISNIKTGKSWNT